MLEPGVAHFGSGRVGGFVGEQSLRGGLGFEPRPVVGDLAIDRGLVPAQHGRHQPGDAVGCQPPSVGHLEGDVRATRQHVVDVQRALVGRGVTDLGSHVPFRPHEGGGQARVRRDQVEHLGSQRAAADVEAARSRVDLAQALYDQAADLQKNGVGTGIDTLRSNVELQNEKQRLIVARTELETALYALARLLNVDPKQRVELADTVSFFDTPEVNLDQTLERAYAARPELRQILSQQQKAELELRAASDARLPKISVSGFWAEQGLNSSNVIPVYNYSANLDVPIFTGGRIQAERERASLAIRQLKQQEQEVRNRIVLDVQTSIAQLRSARSKVDVANLGIELARQEVEQSRDRFQAGVTNNVEVIQAQDGLARAGDNQIAALYRYNQARADLAHSVGQMEALYAK